MTIFNDMDLVAALEVANTFHNIVAWKDLDSKIVMMNQAHANMVGTKSAESIIGTGIYDDKLPCKAAEYATGFREEDQQVFASGERLKLIGQYCYANNEWKVCIAEKAPLYNKAGNMTGLVVTGMEITECNLASVSICLNQFDTQQGLIAQKEQTSYYLTDRYSDLGLTQRQAECLFYLIRGKTAKDIARILDLSFRTVELYLEKIKLKLGVANKAELIEYAINKGFVNYIPESILNHQLEGVLN